LILRFNRAEKMGKNITYKASKDETVYTVNPQTGEATEIYTFPEYTDAELLADYEDGNIYVTTDDNRITL